MRDMRMAEEQVRSLSQQACRSNGTAGHRGGVDGAEVFGTLLPEKEMGRETERSWLRQSS